MMVIVFLIIKPFVGALLASIFLCYLFYPVYRWVRKKVRNKNIASMITTLLVILILILPLFFVLNTLTKEAYVSYLTSKQKLLAMGEMFQNCPQENPFCGLIGYIGDFLNEPQVKYHLESTLGKVTSYIIDHISDMVFSIPKFVLNFFVTIFTLFYLFKDGPKIIGDLKRILPLKDIYKRHLFDRFGNVTFAVIYGYILVSVVQGIVGGIGFFIFGVSSPMIWGFVMIFAAMIPFIGTAIIWLPPAILKLFGGIASNNSHEVIMGLLFLLYGVVLISSIDNVLRPKIISKKARVHPVLILVGVLGGLYLLGTIGVVVGPLVLVLFVTFIGAYERERRSKKKAAKNEA
ncbi:AI-2E family transporter [Candidatus Woesearchaeota archaeon]|nr:AI-2E family transporter [Candidatus Woesearchaeota archaeon]